MIRVIKSTRWAQHVAHITERGGGGEVHPILWGNQKEGHQLENLDIYEIILKQTFDK
jgi:hypothetical protein